MASVLSSDEILLKRHLIIDSAIICFVRNGFFATRITDIAEQAKIGKGTVYVYFKTKEELLLAACLRCCQHHTDAFTQHAQAFLGQTDYEEALSKTLEAFLVTGPNTRQDEARLFANLIDVASGTGLMDVARQEVNNLYLESERLVEALCRQGIAIGAFRSCDPIAFARLVTATLDGLIWQVAWRNDHEQAARAMVALLVDLLSQRPRA
jgi:TetR/AcrR family fatty acid metabolism transcriptional regulator